MCVFGSHQVLQGACSLRVVGKFAASQEPFVDDFLGQWAEGFAWDAVSAGEAFKQGLIFLGEESGQEAVKVEFLKNIFFKTPPPVSRAFPRLRERVLGIIFVLYI